MLHDEGASAAAAGTGELTCQQLPQRTTCLLLGDLGTHPGSSLGLHLLADLRRLGCGCAGARRPEAEASHHPVMGVEGVCSHTHTHLPAAGIKQDFLMIQNYSGSTARRQTNNRLIIQGQELV